MIAKPIFFRDNNILRIFLLSCALGMGGCAVVPKTAKGVWNSSQETAKTFWGSSTRALEVARKEAESRTFACAFDECFDAVLALTRQEQKTLLQQTEKIVDSPSVVFDARSASSYISQRASGPSVPKKKTTVLDLFLENRKKRHLVVMGVPGSVNTTEVGIFFSDTARERQVTVTITSLSPYARLAVAELVFADLEQKFSGAGENP
jgi:hypothetical protein